MSHYDSILDRSKSRIKLRLLLKKWYRPALLLVLTLLFVSYVLLGSYSITFHTLWRDRFPLFFIDVFSKFMYSYYKHMFLFSEHFSWFSFLYSYNNGYYRKEMVDDTRVKKMTRVYNFSAGPACLPEWVLKKAQEENAGCSWKWNER